MSLSLIVLNFAGSAFHSMDPVTEKARRPNSNLNLGTLKSPAAAERRWERPAMSFVGVKIFLI